MATRISEMEAKQSVEAQRLRYVLTISLCGAICALLAVAYTVV